MWSLLLACAWSIDTGLGSNWKIDTVCYPGTGEVNSYLCRAMAELYSPDYWGSDWEFMKDIYSSFIWAGRENASTVLEQSTGYILLIYTSGFMTGEGNDVFDLNNIKGRKVVSAYDLSPYQTLENTQIAQKMARSQAKALAKLKSKRNSSEFTSASSFARALGETLSRKYNKYASKLLGNSTELKPQANSSPATAAYYEGCHITASGDIYSKVDALVLIPTNIVFHNEIYVSFLFVTSFAYGAIVNPKYIKADYVLTDIAGTNYGLFRNLEFKDLGLMVTGHVSSIEFTYNAWKLTYYSSTTSEWVMRTIYYDGTSGQLSILCISDTDVTVSFDVSTSNGEFEAKGLNFSVQSAVSYDVSASRELSDPNLAVEFDPNWDTYVSNAPEFVLESSNPDGIAVTGQPEKVSIKKTSISDRPGLRGPDSGPNVWLIVGIVIGVLVVIGVIVAIVIVIVISTRKKQITCPETAEQTQVTAETASQEPPSIDQEAPASQPSQQAPPSQQHQQPAPQYQHQQQPGQWQYQQPPPQYQYQQQPGQWQYQQPGQWQYQQPGPWQYQQPPPQYQYQQQPEDTKKHKHKHSHKDHNKHKKDKKEDKSSSSEQE